MREIYRLYRTGHGRVLSAWYALVDTVIIVTLRSK